MLVVPSELSGRWIYTITTIALALCGFGADEACTNLRSRLVLGRTFEEGWPSVGRWVRAILDGKLFQWIRGVSELSGRILAQRVAVVLAATSGVRETDAAFEARVWQGATSSWSMEGHR